ncbi:MAG: class I SAM-dependent methyltransferase [Burkholderiales bacterium]|nr:class I SAM-dependent methyltransferase [Burkholderiales bacterium]
MDAGEPSVTARGAALSRAVHQIIDYPRILKDPLAIPILGPLPCSEFQEAVDRRNRGLRASIVMRSRYAEDRLAAAVHRGIRQYVVLGAGLDTFAYRNPHQGLRVFEVDHPATQRFKRERLAHAHVALPAETTFVPVDFETQTLSRELAAAGFRFDQPAFFSMLGVVIYLTDDAVMETMTMIASCAAGSEIVFSFSVPEELLTETQQLSRGRALARLATLGEPWITFYEPSTLAGRLRARGFSAAEVFTPLDANRTYFSDRIDGLRVSTGHMMSARV